MKKYERRIVSAEELLDRMKSSDRAVAARACWHALDRTIMGQHSIGVVFGDHPVRGADGQLMLSGLVESAMAADRDDVAKVRRRADLATGLAAALPRFVGFEHYARDRWLAPLKDGDKLRPLGRIITPRECEVHEQFASAVTSYTNHVVAFSRGISTASELRVSAEALSRVANPRAWGLNNSFNIATVGKGTALYLEAFSRAHPLQEAWPGYYLKVDEAEQPATVMVPSVTTPQVVAPVAVPTAALAEAL